MLRAGFPALSSQAICRLLRLRHEVQRVDRIGYICAATRELESKRRRRTRRSLFLAALGVELHPDDVRTRSRGIEADRDVAAGGVLSVDVRHLRAAEVEDGATGRDVKEHSRHPW